MPNRSARSKGFRQLRLDFTGRSFLFCSCHLVDFTGSPCLAQATLSLAGGPLGLLDVRLFHAHRGVGDLSASRCCADIWKDDEAEEIVLPYKAQEGKAVTIAKVRL